MTRQLLQDKPATAPAPSVTPQSEAKLLFQGQVPIASIKVVSNIRKAFNEAAGKELAENIKALGIISPLVVRPGAGKDQYILVAGERRLRAARQAGLAQVPVRVLELDEQRALEYQAAENIHRKDLTPIEEARTFKALLDARRFTVEQLAELVDKSMPYVYRAVRLLELSAAVIEKIEAGDWTPAHGHQLLRLPEADREKVLKEWSNDFGYEEGRDKAKDLQEFIDDELGSDLTGAKFPKDKPYAGALACTACPNNSGNQGTLFDGAKKGTCTLKPCFEKKVDQHKADFLEKTKAKYPGAEFVEYAKGGYVYPGNRRNGGWIARGVLEKEPKIAYGILVDSSFKLHYATEEKSSGKSSSSSRSGVAPHDWERDNFINDAAITAVYKAEAKEALKTKASRKVYEEVALNILRNHGAAHFAEALGVEKVIVSKLTDDQIAAAMILGTRNFGWHPKKKEIQAEAKKQAAMDWKAKKDEKKA